MGYYTSKFAGSGDTKDTAINALEDNMKIYCNNVILCRNTQSACFGYKGIFYKTFYALKNYPNDSKNTWYAIIY